MNVLIVCSEVNGNISPFIRDQASQLSNKGVNINYLTITKKGILGYLHFAITLRTRIKKEFPDTNLIHAHYGLSGLACVFQRKIPVIITFHGSDINNKKNLLFSKIAQVLANEVIFVSEKLKQKSKSKKGHVIPCGVDLSTFKLMERDLARKQMNLDISKKYILFASDFDRTIKNPQLAINSVSQIPNTELIELKGFSRSQVMVLMNAVDACLLTSYQEGSPQFIKEALACNCPIVSTDVGDVAENLRGIAGCFVVNPVLSEIVSKLKVAVVYGRTLGREKISHFDSQGISNEIIKLYMKVLN